MSIANSLFSRDIARLAQSADAPKLIGRPSTNPDVLAENEFIIKHGMTRQQADEMRLAHQKACAEEEAVRDLNGKAPELANTRGLGPKRAAYANFLEWQHQEAKRLDDLRTRKCEIEATIAAPAATLEAISIAIKQTAATMLGRAHASEKIDRGAMDAQLAHERHMAEAATVALAEVEKQIETAELRVAHLSSREAEFIGPALVEAADCDLKLGQLMLKKIGELRAIMDLVNGLAGLAGVAGGYGSGFENRTDIKFAKTGLPSIADRPGSDYVISAAGNSEVWHQFSRALRHSPATRAAQFIPVPK